MHIHIPLRCFFCHSSVPLLWPSIATFGRPPGRATKETKGSEMVLKLTDLHHVWIVQDDHVLLSFSCSSCSEVHLSLPSATIGISSQQASASKAKTTSQGHSQHHSRGISLWGVWSRLQVGSDYGGLLRVGHSDKLISPLLTLHHPSVLWINEALGRAFLRWCWKILWTVLKLALKNG